MQNAAPNAAPDVPAPAGVRPYFADQAGRFALYQGDCIELMGLFAPERFDLIFADPPYFLSNDGITCHAGKMVSVNKGRWDRSMGFAGNYAFTKRWLGACQRLLKPNGTIWVSGTSHIIHIVGAVMDELGLKNLNDITWVKPNPPPNLSCRYFVHATETILWAGRDKKTRHKFNYQLMKRINAGKQMKSVWTDIDTPRRDEKVFGKHPTQKPLALLERIIAASTDEDDLVLDPFSGSATTGIAAARMNRQSIGLELETEFLDMGVRRFVGVPQADNPQRILDLIRLHAADNPTPHELARLLRISERQVHYYRQAASVLGLLRRSGNGWALTETGQEICGKRETKSRSILARTMLDFSLVQAAVRKTERYRTRATKCRIIAELLSRSTSLTGSTCNRRAQTLLSWIDWARMHWKSNGDVVSAAEETNNSLVAEDLKLLPDFGADSGVGRMQRRQLRLKFVHLR